jgi:hypothetical protein
MPIIAVSGSDILFPDGPRPILNDDRPAVFLPGWRAVNAYTGLAPVTIVMFLNESGDEGLWFLDSELHRRGGTVREVPASMRADLMDGLCRLLDGLWNALALSDQARPITPAEQDFLDLPEHCRANLLDLYLGGFDAGLSFRRFEDPGSGAAETPTLTCGMRTIPLRMQGLHGLFDPGLLQREQRRLITEGYMELPSPVDGSPLRCDRSLALGPDLVAYRLHDPRWGLTAYVLAGEIYFRTMAVYVPEARLVLASDPDAVQARWPDLELLFRRHLARHGRALFGYLSASATTPLHFWRGRNAMHLGHVLWNDLSGIASLVETSPAGVLPPFLVCESGSQPEMYGALDRIFPELQDKVLRREEPFVALIDWFYETGVCLFRSSGMQVTRTLRDRISAPARHADAPVILFGLRTENRTLDDLPAFCRALVAHVAGTVGRAVLVVDGHNRHEGGEGGMIWSHGELQAQVSPVEAEQELVEVIREAARGTGVEIVSTIGEPVAESVAWGRAARFFVSFWGAGLAKYRWVCNCPGVVLTNHWNLGNLNDLHIYSHPDVMDEPTPMVFVPAEAVHDLPDAPLRVRHGDAHVPSLCNFRVDLPAVMSAVDAMAHERLAVVAPVAAAPEVLARPAPVTAPARKARGRKVQAG